MTKRQLTILILLLTAVVGTSHAAQWTLLHCDHRPGSPNDDYKSWTTMFLATDTASLNLAIEACQANQGTITVTTHHD